MHHAPAQSNAHGVCTAHHGRGVASGSALQRPWLCGPLWTSAVLESHSAMHDGCAAPLQLETGDDVTIRFGATLLLTSGWCAGGSVMCV